MGLKPVFEIRNSVLSRGNSYVPLGRLTELCNSDAARYRTLSYFKKVRFIYCSFADIVSFVLVKCEFATYLN